jgi:hypothetical protein
MGIIAQAKNRKLISQPIVLETRYVLSGVNRDWNEI